MEFIQRYLSQTARIVGEFDPKEIEAGVALLKGVRERQGRLFFLGSGGGAGHASHATCDFRKLGGFNAFCPLDNISELTARINDEGWDLSLSNHLRASQLNRNDCLFIFSVGGGNEEKNISTNLVRAIQLAGEVGAKVLSIVGKRQGYAARQSDVCLIIPTVDERLITPHTEGMQAVLWHLLISHPDLQIHPTKWESSK